MIHQPSVSPLTPTGGDAIEASSLESAAPESQDPDGQLAVGLDDPTRDTVHPAYPSEERDQEPGEVHDPDGAAEDEVDEHER